MMPTDEENLRKQVQKRRSDVARKIARIQKSTGARVSGTDFDPRKYVPNIKEFSSQALRIHLYELNQFMSRSVQFVSLRNGLAAPRQLWHEKEKVETDLKNLAESFQSKYKDIPSPGQKEQRSRTDTLEMMNNRLYKRPNQDQSWSPYPILSRGAREFDTVAKLQNYVDKMQAKNYPEYEEDRTEFEREHNRKALVEMGQEDLADLFDTLSDDQFRAVWYANPRYQNIVFLRYEADKARKAGKPKDAAYEKAVENAFEEIEEMAHWGKTLFVEEEE